MIFLILGIIFIIIISIFFCSHYWLKYKINQQKLNDLQAEIETKYIKADVRIYNAVVQAKEHAIKNNNTFEANIFQTLLDEINGRR